MVSSIAHLSEALAADLTRRYGCPVLDVYALTEAGIVAVRTPQGYAVLPHDLHVEILDAHDQPVAEGGRGEVVLTGGRNPYLPLLRYRTGDFATLAWHAGRPVLVDLEGRHPVLFPVGGDRVVHSMEVTRLLRRFPLTQYRLHQDEDGGFRFSYRGLVPEDEFLPALRELLNSPRSLTVEVLSAESGTAPQGGRLSLGPQAYGGRENRAISGPVVRCDSDNYTWQSASGCCRVPHAGRCFATRSTPQPVNGPFLHYAPPTFTSLRFRRCGLRSRDRGSWHHRPTLRNDRIGSARRSTRRRRAG